MRIVIVDCDHDSFEPELELAREEGVRLEFAAGDGPAERLAAAAGADGIVMQYLPITGTALDALPGLRAIGRYGVGYDTVDLPAATSRGIAVCTVPDYGTESVSDHAIALATAVGRGIVQLDRAVRSGSFDITPVRPLHDVAGRTFGVVGLGAIGSATAAKAAGLGYRVIGTDIAMSPGTTSPRGVPVVGFDDLLARSHVVSFHVPLDDSTRHLLDVRRIGQLRPDVIVVNTARGGIVDTTALAAALAEGRLAGAGLDVFEDEPLAVDHPLIALPNVVLTPHAAWYTKESWLRLKSRTLQNVIDVCAGRRPRTILNPEVLAPSTGPGRDT